MPKSFRSQVLLQSIIAVVSFTAMATRTTQACTFRYEPVSDRFARSEIAVLVDWISGTRGTATKPGQTVCAVKQIVRGAYQVAENQQITLNYFLDRPVGGSFILTSQSTVRTNKIIWEAPLPGGEATLRYMLDAPTPGGVPAERLMWFQRYLESADSAIGQDAFWELMLAEFEDLKPVAAQFSRDKLRTWIDDPRVPQERHNLYGLMLGVCGDQSDARFLEERILLQTREFRPGIEGLMNGYLLLTGERGLAVLDKHKLENKKIPFIETFAAMQAVRFMWKHGNGLIAADRLRQSMRILLDRPEIADMVIVELYRWKDWSVQERLMKMYGEGEFKIPPIKRAIVRYMLACSKDSARDSEAVPEHAVRAEKLLNELRQKDPKTVSDVERFLIAW